MIRIEEELVVNNKTIDARILSRMFLAGAKNLEAKKEWINELNVFPVPDGDTGTNMTPTLLMEKLASMSCKAAIKGNDAISFREAESLINGLMTAENPYNCPHGRPTLISMSKYEIEKKFKRIV